MTILSYIDGVMGRVRAAAERKRQQEAEADEVRLRIERANADYVYDLGRHRSPMPDGDVS